jgi:glutathione S-transferase
MKLYTSLGPNPMVVEFFILEKKLPPDLIQPVEVDIVRGENREPPYMTTINPFGQLPALQLASGAVLCEVTAICEYLDGFGESPSLIGTTPEEKAETRMWTRRVDLNICDPAANIVRYSPNIALEFFKNRRVCMPEAVDGLTRSVTNSLNLVDRLMAGKTYLVGERFSLADIFMFSFFLRLGSRLSFLLDPQRQNLHRWYDTVHARPAVQFLRPHPKS